MVTAELAAVLPVLVLVVAIALGALSVASARVRAQDAAREAARAAARADTSAVDELAQRAAPGAHIRITRSGELVSATASVTVRPVGSWLPTVTITERAVALAEPP